MSSLPAKVRLQPQLLFFRLSIDKNKSEISTALLWVTHVAQAVSVGTTSIKVPVVERSIPGWKLVGGLEQLPGISSSSSPYPHFCLTILSDPASLSMLATCPVELFLF